MVRSTYSINPRKVQFHEFAAKQRSTCLQCLAITPASGLTGWAARVIELVVLPLTRPVWLRLQRAEARLQLCKERLKSGPCSRMQPHQAKHTKP